MGPVLATISTLSTATAAAATTTTARPEQLAVGIAIVTSEVINRWPGEGSRSDHGGRCVG